MICQRYDYAIFSAAIFFALITLLYAAMPAMPMFRLLFRRYAMITAALITP